MPMIGAFIYALKDPRNDEVRYVGVSKYSVTRYKQHICNTNKNNVAKSDWINELKAIGLLPTFIILEDNVEWDERFKHESYWIKYYLECGSPLTNQLERKEGHKSAQARQKEARERKYAELLQLLEDM
jgi:hypothetical protein